MNKKDLIAVRAGDVADKDFIEATWKQGLYYGNDYFRMIDQETYFQNYGKFIVSILERPTVTVSVACLKDEPTLNLAYSVYDGKTLHWVYCKYDWRGIGLLNDLLPAEITEVTHLTRAGHAILRKKFPNAIFNPFT